MAETSKKTTVKYKFGQRELDMQDYINNIDYNVQSYVNDRKQNRGWTDDQVAEFQASYNRLINAFKQQLTDNSNRFSADAFGTITDSQGEFDNVDNDDIDPSGSQYYYNDKGERITTNDYNLLKDKKKKNYKTFDANRQVAEYFRIIGNKLQNAPKPETTKFDLNKHGFAAWWNKVNNPMGGEPYLQPYLDQDPVDANGKRKVNKRAKIAADWMDEYLKWLGTQDLDYSNYDQFKDYDTYANQGKALAAKWRDNKWESDDIIKANAFGVDPKFSKGFFTTEENADLTLAEKEQIAAEKKAAEEKKKAAEEKKKAEEEQKREEELKLARQQWVNNVANIFNNKYSKWYSLENPNRMQFTRNEWYTDDGKLKADKLFQSWNTYYLNQDKTGLDSVKLNWYMDEFLKAPFRDYKNDERVRNILSLIYSGIAEPITEGKLKGMYYIPRQSDTQDYGALIYNPNKQQLFYSFIANVPSVWNNLKTQYLKKYENLNTNAEHYFKEGGVIFLQYGGDFGSAFANKRNDYIKSKADAANTDVKTYTARSREPGGRKNALKPNNGFTSNDILRLTAIGTDLASMVASFTPFVGASTALGAAGTTQHLIADIREDGLDWGDIGNAALGYSMDVLGLIPGTAAATKSAKIIKTLKTFTPRIIAAMGTVGTIANAPEMVKSLNKLNSDEHLTVQDWQNITNAVTLVVQGVAAGGRKYHTVRGTARGLVKPAQTTDNVAIRVRKKGTNNIENIVLTKSETEKAKATKNNKELSNILQSRKDMEGYELATNNSLIPGLRIPRNGNSMFYFKQQRAHLMPVMVDQKTGRLFARNGRWGADVIGDTHLPNNKRLAGSTSKYRETLRQNKLKEGGKFNNVRKYNLGNTITNVTSNADWFTDMYSHQSMQDWLNKIDATNYETFNDFQTSWKQNLIKSGYKPGKEAKGGTNGPDPEIKKRQENWNTTGTNAAIQQAIANKKIKPSGNSGDNTNGGFADGYFGAQEYLRHGGTGDSWKGHNTELQTLVNTFKSKGLDYYLDLKTNMYLLKPLESTDKKGTTPVDSKKSSKLYALGDKEDVEEKQSTNFDQVRQFNIDPRVYSVAHNAYANTVNNKMTANTIDAMRRGLTLYDPKNSTKYLEGDFDALMNGQQAAGQLMHLASQPLISDGNTQTSAYTDSVIKALDYIRQNNAINNQAFKKSKDEIWKLRYDEGNANYDRAMKNRQIIGDYIDNIANAENVHDAKEFANNDVLNKELLTPIKQKANKREAMEKYYALLDIENDVKYNLSEYAKQSGKPLSKDEEEAWQAVISGDKTYSELGGEDKEAQKRLQKAYINALRKASEIEQDKNREYYGIAPGKYSASRQMAAKNALDEFTDFKLAPKRTQKVEKEGLLTLKDGSKIAVAKIRERSKNADRFYKAVKDIHDRVDKAIARVDKKMYRRRDPEKRRK